MRSHLRDVPSPVQQILTRSLPFQLLLVLQVSAHPSKQTHPVLKSFYLLFSLNKRVIHRGIQLYRHWAVPTTCCYLVWKCATLWIGHAPHSFSLPALRCNTMLLRVMVLAILMVLMVHSSQDLRVIRRIGGGMSGVIRSSHLGAFIYEVLLLAHHGLLYGLLLL